MDPPTYAQELTEKEIKYVRKIRNDQDNLIFHLREQRVCVMRNCEDDGDLCDITLPKSYYEKKRKHPWVLLLIKQFKTHEGGKYEVPVCCACQPEMMNCSEKQNYQQMCKVLCHHARVAGWVVRDFSNPYFMSNWLSLAEDDIEDENISTCDIFLKKTCQSTKSQSLAVTKIKGKIHLLYTTGKQSSPTCTGHSSDTKCHEKRLFKSKTENVENEKQPSRADHPSGENLPSADENDDSHTGRTNNVFGAPTYDERVRAAHYDEVDMREYGYNYTPIPFPFYTSEEQKTIIEERFNAPLTFPSDLIPELAEGEKCTHGNTFSEDIRLLTDKVSVFSDKGEIQLESNLYCRDTIGRCRCVKHYDGHPLMMYHCQIGVFLDYQTLQLFWIANSQTGISTYGFHKSICHSLKSNRGSNNTFRMKYETFNKAVDGFCMLVDIDYEECFSCINCGRDPKWFVGDGKQDCAPLKEKLDKLSVHETTCHPDDKQILEQSTFHHDRIFLSQKSERDLILSVISENISISEFLKQKHKINSENGKSVLKVIEKFTDFKTIPESYTAFLHELAINSPVAGFIQNKSTKSLQILEMFCLQQLNIRSVDKIKYLKVLQQELPAVSSMILSICEYEKTEFLPLEISKIVIELLRIHKNTFENTTQRYKEDYIPYNEPKDPPTEFFPLHPLVYWPKRYRVNKSVDKDFCTKNFATNSDFCDGIFSIGKQYLFKLAVTGDDALTFILHCRLLL